tara:strand:+ start:82 stop:255 length:174 start_codon:yes stop_codon:yes gene_type:complete
MEFIQKEDIKIGVKFLSSEINEKEFIKNCIHHLKKSCDCNSRCIYNWDRKTKKNENN